MGVGYGLTKSPRFLSPGFSQNHFITPALSLSRPHCQAWHVDVHIKLHIWSRHYSDTVFKRRIWILNFKCQGSTNGSSHQFPPFSPMAEDAILPSRISPKTRGRSSNPAQCAEEECLLGLQVFLEGNAWKDAGEILSILGLWWRHWPLRYTWT